MERVKLIYGIGNELSRLKNTKHNLGKEIIEKYFQKPKALKRAFYEKYQNLILATNRGFVNESGKGLKELIVKLKIKPENVLVLQDDTDLTFPIFKISFASGSAGHKGIESIIQNLKTKNFWRFRLGVRGSEKEKAEKIVLKKWNLKEKETFEKIKEKFKIIFELLEKRGPNELNLPKDYFKWT